MTSEAVPHASSAPPLPLLRRLEAGELMDEVFDLYKKNFRLFFGIAILLDLPVGALLVAAPDNNTGASAWINILNAVATFITTGALVYAAMERYLGRPATVIGAYRVGLRRALKMAGAALIAGLAASVGLLLLVVPGVLVALWSMLVAPIVVLENRGGTGALERARQLSSGQLWRVFFLSMSLLFVILVFTIVLLALAGLAATLTGTDQAPTPDRSSTAEIALQAVMTLVLVLFQSAWTPVLAAAQYLMYVDLRIRREAYDLELLAGAVEARVSREQRGAAEGMPALSRPGVT